MTDKPSYKELEQSLKELERIFNFSIDMIGSGNLEGYFTKINSSFGKILGYTEKEFLEKPFILFVHDEDVEKTKEALVDAVNGKKEIYIENRYKCKDGSCKWIEWKILSIVQENKFIAVGREITERKQAENELRESEERFRAITNTAMDSIFCKNINKQYTFVNPPMAQLMGCTEADLVGKVPDEIFDKEEAAIVNEVDKRSLSGEKVSEVRSLTIAGKPYIFHTIQVPLHDSDGNIKGISGIVRDITKLRQAEKALERSAIEYNFFAENITDAILVISLDRFVFSYVSPSVESIFGYTVEEFRNLNIYDILIPDSADQVMEVIAQELEKDRIGKAEPQQLELEILRKGGFASWMEVSARFLRDDKRHVASILCVARDVSERKNTEKKLKESEEKYRLLADNVSDVIWTIDMDLNYTYISPSIASLIGFTVEEALALSLEETATPASYDVVIKSLTEELEMHSKGQKPKDRARVMEAELYRKDGSTVWTEIEANFIYDSNGQPESMIGVTRNIAERKKAEDAIKKANEQLEEKVKERTIEIEEKNVALKVLLDQRGDDKKKLEESIMSNVKKLLMPNLTRLKSGALSSKQQTVLNILESNLNEIISPFSNNASSSYMKLTPTEIQVANFIKFGSSSKDIAEALGLSRRTVDAHRYNIRRKLQISGKDINLSTYLASLT